MLWVIQNNLYNEAGYVRFIEALERLEMDYMVVKPVPFTNKILHPDFDSFEDDFETAEEPFIDTNQKIMAMGATSLSRISKARGWSPGTYLNDNFDFEVWRDGYGVDNVLNSDAVVGPVHSIANIHNHDWVFVRPTHDTKSFSGEILSKYDLDDWLQSISMMEEEEFTPLHKNTEMIIAGVKNIMSEYRLFVVNGKVVASSMYKQGNRVISSEGADHDVLWFAAEMINQWEPADAYVLDIAKTDQGLKVIEINNINSAGFYEADVQQIIMAIADLEEYGRTRPTGAI